MTDCKSYEIVEDGRAITCRICHRTSWNRGDVEHRYCGACRVFHDQLHRCGHCGEPVLPGERLAEIRGDGAPFHWECGMRMVVGGLNHLNGLCSCRLCGQSLPPDPEGVSRRRAAQMAAQAWLARNPATKEPK